MIMWSHFGSIVAVYGLLFLFGFLYNRFVEWLEKNNYDEGYTAFLVVGGVAVTLMGLALLDWQAALVALGAFAVSGFWMVVGSCQRHMQARRTAQKALRERRLEVSLDDEAA